MSFYLANSSANKAELISQLDRLDEITSGNCCTGSPDAKTSSLVIDESFILQGRKLPGKLVGKIKISPKNGFTRDIGSFAIDYLTGLLPADDDPVYLGYLKKYNLTDPYTFVFIHDVNSNVFINPRIVSVLASNAVTHLKQESITFVCIQTASQGLPAKNSLDLSVFDNERITAKVTPLLEWELAVKLAIACRNHIAPLSNLSIMCAKINTDEKVVFAQMPTISTGASAPGKGWFILDIQQESTVYFDRVYYINLDRRPDRRMHMEGQLSKLKLGSARVVAQDGNTLEWHQNLGIASKYWNKGALGYCLSYQNAIVDALKNGHQRILVMDDDAVLSDNFLEVLDQSFQTLPDDWHMLYLAANHNKESMPTATERVSEHLFRLKGSVGSHAIIINRPAFETILNFASSPYGPLDVFLSVYQQLCPCYITYPGLATQMPGRSDIIEQDVDYMKDWGLDYINHIAYLKEAASETLKN